ncbi:hypothetical protein CONCODRAFT_8682 [Conidiobolus coronatus NRRL 28638]|uniref:Uncharacterized protein n=1 Tax=Conidiobolus coronatus (strain ATCC 28846 / CBS 209.66 / NRRL 28638) TaxID=796925 RepID=A0A137P1U6_CONC2|nr:hypothetical protein CONCODRAFT_8682 [Conidiobolus coronatus NRRL 28638]|eukprot:KXN68982.1 hypothetical protein CONCODRAFT_8682 [Conidiobolus coronatus NRRL 28638]
MLAVDNQTQPSKFMSFVTKLKKVPRLVDDWLMTKQQVDIPEYYAAAHQYHFSSPHLRQYTNSNNSTKVSPQYGHKQRNSISTELAPSQRKGSVRYRSNKGTQLERPKTTFEVRNDLPVIPIVEELAPITVSQLLEKPTKPQVPPKVNVPKIKRKSVEQKHISLRREVKVTYTQNNQKIAKPRHRQSKLDFQTQSSQFQAIRANLANANAKLGLSTQRVKVAHQLLKQRQQTFENAIIEERIVTPSSAPPVNCVKKVVNNKRISRIAAFDRAIANKRGSTLKLSLTPKVAS